jgi:hypothetical protein
MTRRHVCRRLGAGAWLLAVVMAVPSAGASVGESRKYRVTVRVDKRSNFSAYKTYTWDPGRPALEAMVHQQVVAAIDRELAALGYTKLPVAPADVVVSYASVLRSDIDLKSKARGPRGERPTYPVASLLVLIRHPITGRELFLARVAMRVDSSPEAFAARIDDRVSKIFERYPHSSD